MSKKKNIIGAGGGGGGGKGGGGGGGAGRVAQESPDTLRSIAYANVLDLVSEGEIEGLANGLKSVYFNNTPLQNDNNTYNFTGATVVSTRGTQDQSYIEGFPAVENEIGVNTQVEYATPIVRQISNSDVDAVRVTISIPQLTQQNTSNGDINGASVQYAIDVQSNGGGYVPQILGNVWQNNSITKVSDTLARANQAVYQMQIQVTDTSNSAVYAVQYKLQSSPTWITTGLTSSTDVQTQEVTYQNTDSEGGIRWLNNTETVTVKTFTTPYTNAGLFEMRVVITSGSPYISTVNGNIGTPYFTISGKTTSKYQKSHRIKLTGSAPWDIKVRRITADSTSSALQNKTFWDSYTEIIDGKFRYPNSAIVGVRIDASQFDSIPTRSYDLKLLKIKIPTNYNPITRVYSGIWDGTFKVSWTDNPAWCFYDLLTNDRYGLGGFIAESQVDKWTLYEIGKYCDELVPNGFGGTEPRYTCNIYLQSREEAYKVINDMASIFRGMPYWASGSITVGYDAPSDPVYQFTNANVIDGVFTYQGSAIKARHTVALVTWNDPDDFYRQKVEYVEDADGISRYGIVQTEVLAVGCTSRGQANRVGRWILFTEQSETEVVTFRTGLEGNQIRPSNVIQIADEARAGSRIGGRIVNAFNNVITVDQTISSITGIVGGNLSVLLPSGSLETKLITNASQNSITVSSAFSETPSPNAIWMVETSTLSLQTFRVTSIVEEDDGLTVTALAHNPSKYNEVEQGLILQPRVISSLSVVPEAPNNLAVTEALYEEGADINVLVTLSWSPVQRATGYQVSYKVDDRNYVTLPVTQATSIDIRNALDGQYEFKVFAINSVGKRSAPSILNSQIYGKTAPPADVTNFAVNIIGTQAHLSWTPVGDLDLAYYRIRHSTLTTGATYSEAIDIIDKVARPANTTVVPAMTGTYFIKAYDKLDNASINATSSVAIINNISGLNVVETITESPAFLGQKIECNVSELGLVLDTSIDFDSVAGLFDDVEGLFDGGGGTTSTEGTYYFENYLDLGNVYTSRITANVEVGRIDYVNTFDAKEGDFDAATGDFDGDPDSFDDTNVELWVSTTDDDPNGSPAIWTAYRRFLVGDYTARGFRFKAVLTSTDESASPVLKTLTVNVDMPDRVIGGDDLISGTNAGGYSVTFSPSFKVAPSIGIMAQNLQQGDFYEIPTKSASGFTIRFKNSGGTVVSRTFDYVAKGYGELVT
jgi:predicted phage tail protein